jgi:hypothetical protein
VEQRVFALPFPNNVLLANWAMAKTIACYTKPADEKMFIAGFLCQREQQPGKYR